LMLIKFLCSRKGYDAHVVVEGDDAVLRLDGPCPSLEDFAAMGFQAKVEFYDDVGLAGFCKMKFSETLQPVCDPIERLAKFGWTGCVRCGQRRRNDLLYTKALSLLAEYPTCPIISVFARKIIALLRSTRQKLHLAFDEEPGWIKSKLERVGNDKLEWFCHKQLIHDDTRMLFARLYDISVEQQLDIEKYFEGWDHVQVIDHPLILQRCPDVWYDNYRRFVSEHYVDGAHGVEVSW